MKKIIFFSKNLNIGGMEKALVSLLNVLTEYYDITLVLESKTGDLLKYLNGKIKVEEYQLSQNQNILVRKVLNFLKRLKWKMKNSNKYDFACNYSTYSFCGTKLSLIASKNNALYIHSNYVKMLKDKNSIVNFFKRHDLNKIKNIIFVSNESKDDLQTIYPEFSNKFYVINNLFDYKNILSLSKEDIKKFDSKYKNFIFIGRLENESKNLDLLLNSFKSVIEKNNNYRLYIIGDGPYLKNAKDFIYKNELKNNILLLLKKENPYPYLKESDCLILTSNYEGFPVVYMEALVLNKAILTTIPVSCPYIDIRNYAIILNYNIEDISKKILKFKRENINYKIDFEKINNMQIEDLKSLIER